MGKQYNEQEVAEYKEFLAEQDNISKELEELENLEGFCELRDNDSIYLDDE